MGFWTLMVFLKCASYPTCRNVFVMALAPSLFVEPHSTTHCHGLSTIVTCWATQHCILHRHALFRVPVAASVCFNILASTSITLRLNPKHNWLMTLLGNNTLGHIFPYLSSLLILSIHLMRGISLSSTILMMSSCSPYESIPAELPFGNMSYNWLYFRSMSSVSTLMPSIRRLRVTERRQKCPIWRNRMVCQASV